MYAGVGVGSWPGQEKLLQNSKTAPSAAIPTFLATGSIFLEDHFSMEREGGAGFGMEVFHLPSSGISQTLLRSTQNLDSWCAQFTGGLLLL
uniref:Uncharacterized protein n=1 Tax=Pan paniscus TaxID=9597 RepID=A0A2R8ZW09_PANPA